MKATITKIHPKKYSRNGNAFIRVEFQMEDGSWAKTDLCPDYRNYQRWKNILKVGTPLDGLEFKRKGEVNADSYPEVIKKKSVGHYVEKEDGTMVWVEEKIEESDELQDMGAKQEKLI